MSNFMHFKKEMVHLFFSKVNNSFAIFRLHEERVDRERQMALEHRISMVTTPTSGSGSFYPHQTPSTPHTPQPNPLSCQPTPPTSSANDDSVRPNSPVLNLSSKGPGADSEGEDKDDDLDQDMSRNGDRIGVQDSEREDEARRIHLPPLPPRTRENNNDDRLSDMDDEDVDKDECK